MNALNIGWIRRAAFSNFDERSESKSRAQGPQKSRALRPGAGLRRDAGRFLGTAAGLGAYAVGGGAVGEAVYE